MIMKHHSYLARPGMKVSIISPINGCLSGVGGNFRPIDRLIEFIRLDKAPTGEYGCGE